MGPNTPHILMSCQQVRAGRGGRDPGRAGALRSGRAGDGAGSRKWPAAPMPGPALGSCWTCAPACCSTRITRRCPAPSSPIASAQGWNPPEPGAPPTDLRGFFPTLSEADGPHGGRFHYVSPNTDLLGWAIERAAGSAMPTWCRRVLWAPMGAQRDAYITVDRLGAPRCAGGVCATARDLARLGQLIAQGGARDGRQIIPAGVDRRHHRRRPRRPGTRATSPICSPGRRCTTATNGM
jgi:hypothetical protein